MSLVAKDLVAHLKTEKNRVSGMSYETAFHVTRQALERAIGALEQIDHATSDVKLKVVTDNE